MRAQPSILQESAQELLWRYLTNAAAELGRRSVCRPPLACGTVNS
jgi:hypothetical protein